MSSVSNTESVTYWAKPDQSYEHHINAAYDAWKDTVRSKKNLIERVCNIYGLKKEHFLKSSLLTIVLHDIGKNIEPFQKMMEAKRNNEKFDISKNYRHELVSFPYALLGGLYLSKENSKNSENSSCCKFPFESLVIVGHHRNIDPALLSFVRECKSDKPKYLNDGIIYALKLAEEIFEREGFSFPKIPIHEYNPYIEVSKMISYDGIFVKIYEKEKNNKYIENNNGTERIRIIYSLLKAILHYADWHASSKIPMNYSLKYGDIDIHREIEKRCIDKNIKFDKLRPFQKECGSILDNVITIAPCGSGKTEASLLWAFNNLKDMKEGKIIYLLPTMVTANGIYGRLGNYFGEWNIGLSHSTASIMFEDDDGKDSSRETRNVLFDKSFIKPVTVATIDQLLLAGFNTGKWCLIEANTANSVVIIDEIHSYDTWTLGLIVESIKHFSKLGTRFMLMSATMPNYLIELFSDIIPNIKIVRDETLSNVSRNHYKTFDKYIEEAIPDIEKSVKMGFKTLVIVNTVSKCQEFYDKLEYLKPICYHAMFILNDRFKKEEIIELMDKNKHESKLLIATQVVEVSLDIDFDNTFTECAPPDALVQRFGRNNRRGTKPNSNVYIYKASEKSKKIYDSDNDGLLSRTFDVLKNSQENLTENDLINIVENVYSNVDIEKSQNFIDATCQYTKTQERLMSVFDNIDKEDRDDKTRKVRYLHVPVIPTIFRDKVMSLSSSQRRLYEVKIPYWYAKKYQEYVKDIMFCSMEYNSMIGAQLKKDNNT